MVIKQTNTDLVNYWESLYSDIKSTQISDEEGGFLEQIFTQLILDLLCESGETDNPVLAYLEKALGTKNQLKVNAYSVSENYETIDLFITIFNDKNNIQKIIKEEVVTAKKRINNFINRAFSRDYLTYIEESSEIFEFVHTLNQLNEIKENLVRINVMILTNGLSSLSIPKEEIPDLNVTIYYRIIDLEYIYNISEKTHIPIEIDFKSDGYDIPCITSPDNSLYQSYLCIFPGETLVDMYERFGARLLEQNVRSFLQFTGKVNKGIRGTISNEPNMFLAFNNGITATANEIELSNRPNGGFLISKVEDFQIVNGGQTTASLYHALKKNKDIKIKDVFVQVKITVIKDNENFGTIVARIAEFANTQNKVSYSDLTSNNPSHVALEKLSRTIYTPCSTNKTIQTRWFYERSRGQYKNERLKEGFTKSRQKAFDLKNPRNQVFKKEELAKYINSYKEKIIGTQSVIGPHIVVHGSQKNYVKFITYNLKPKDKIDNIYFEDIIAKAIIFKTAEKKYGKKPNSIGDMRYITVPYSIALLNKLLDYKLDLYNIWKNQCLSEELQEVLYKLMVKIEFEIKNTAPGGLYSEWAKKEACWNLIKNKEFNINLPSLKNDLLDKNQVLRPRKTDAKINLSNYRNEEKRVISIPSKTWKEIREWGRESELLSFHLQTSALNIALKIRRKKKIDSQDVEDGINILNTVINKAPEILSNIDEFETNNNK